MADAWGAIERGLGTVLNGIYEVVPSYIFAIVLLTVAVRIVLIPLTLKQIRSMAAMQKIQPELKRIQQKYKGNRQKMNEEVMKLYREHGVNPLGGCFPLVMQAPVFIALYSVLRAVIPAPAVPAPPIEAGQLAVKNTVCRPAVPPNVEGPGTSEVICRPEKGPEQRFRVSTPLPTFVTLCRPVEVGPAGSRTIQFGCASPVGTGHLPKDGGLFEDVIEDRTSFLGMHLGCSPTQASSKTTIRQCAPNAEDAGGGALVGYYALVALMAGTTYWQQRQMTARATGPQAKQMQLMMRIMPVFLGFISLSIPAGVIVYWIASNMWTIGQQTVFFKRGELGAPAPAKPDKKGKGK